MEENTAKEITKESFGQYLRREREFRGITLEQVSQKTRIAINNLKNLEADRLMDLPSAAFVKGYLRSMAREVGLDANDLVLRFEAALTERGPVVAPSRRVIVKSLAPKGTAGSENTQVGPEVRQPWPWQAWVLVGLVVLLPLVISTIYFNSSDKKAAGDHPNTAVSKEELSAIKEGVAPETVAPAATEAKAAESASSGHAPTKPVVAAKPATTELAAQVVSEQQTLVLTAVTDSWLRIGLDDKTPVEVTLKKDQSVKYKAEKRFDLLLGNAGGVDVTFNGKSLGKVGEEGTVKRLVLPSANIH